MKRGTPIVLKVHGLCLWRGATRILTDVAWEVRRGQHWTILGPNGCGKTSLLAALTGYMTPSAGSLQLLGRRYGEDDWSELRTRVGLVSPTLARWIPDSETAEDILVGGRHGQIDFWGRARPGDRSLARTLLRRVECRDLADRPWGFLSQGERQRVLIARALMPRPRVLILDEPCAGLDPVAREHFLQFIGRLGRTRSTPALVLVTHHADEIVPPFNHTLLLRAGRVVAAGPTSAILTSANLSQVFDSPLSLGLREGRYHLRVRPVPRLIV